MAERDIDRKKEFYRNLETSFINAKVIRSRFDELIKKNKNTIDVNERLKMQIIKSLTKYIEQVVNSVKEIEKLSREFYSNYELVESNLSFLPEERNINLDVIENIFTYTGRFDDRVNDINTDDLNTFKNGLTDLLVRLSANQSMIYRDVTSLIAHRKRVFDMNSKELKNVVEIKKMQFQKSEIHHQSLRELNKLELDRDIEKDNLALKREELQLSSKFKQDELKSNSEIRKEELKMNIRIEEIKLKMMELKMKPPNFSI